MDHETKDTLKKVAEYTAEEQKKMKNKMIDMMAGATILLVFCSVLFEGETKGMLNGIIPESACHNIMMFSQGLAIAVLALNIMHLMGVFDKIGQWKRNRKSDKEQ